MKTVQQCLRETDAEELIENYLERYPIDFQMLRDKEVPVAQVFETVKENLRSLIQYLRSMAAVPSENEIFYAVHGMGGQGSKVEANLSYRSEILKNELPEHYVWEFTDWEQVLGWKIAGTKLTIDHMGEILADILFELTFFGSDHGEWKQKRDEFEASLKESIEEMKQGNVCPVEDVFAEFGLPQDEPDETADELERSVYQATADYDLHSRMREAAKVRELLLQSENKQWST